MDAATAPVLTTDAVTVTTDHMGRLYAVIPDDVARPLAVAARKGIDPQAHGMFFESDPHLADSWAATTVRTNFEAVPSSPLAQDDDHAWGLNLYPKYGGGTFYGPSSARADGTPTPAGGATTSRPVNCASAVARPSSPRAAPPSPEPAPSDRPPPPNPSARTRASVGPPAIPPAHDTREKTTRCPSPDSRLQPPTCPRSPTVNGLGSPPAEALCPYGATPGTRTSSVPPCAPATARTAQLC